MAATKFSLDDFLTYCLEYIQSTGSTKGMKTNAANHFGVDRRTISRTLADLRRQKRLGRDVFKRWRDSCDSTD